MYVILGLLLIIPTLIGLVRAWYKLVRWGEIHIKPRFGDRHGFIISAVLLPLAFAVVLTIATIILGRYYGAYLFGGVLVAFALYGIFWLYMRYIWR
ncbi:MAG: hypothetical protein U5P41_15445 [Gammaproteobacteria bacterium]|nr:hypothetical protein [Gammaproteobacteria bacterium]